MSLGERIHHLRKARGLSQEQLADSLNVSRQAISKWETDQSSPEIENILALSRVFSVSTDELLGSDIAKNNATSSLQSDLGKERPSFIASVSRRVKPIVNSRIIFLFFSILCFIAIGTCVIVNYSIDKQITWAAYPALSVPVGWLIIVPLLFRKYIASLCMFSVAAIPFLFFLERITPVTDWFIPLGLPTAIVGIVYAWIIYLSFRYIKISIWYKCAFTVFLSGVIDNVIVNHYVSVYHGTDIGFLQYFISIFSYVIVFAAFLVVGLVRKSLKTTDD